MELYDGGHSHGYLHESCERSDQRTAQPEDYRELQHSHESGDNFGSGDIYGSGGGCRRRGGAGNRDVPSGNQHGDVHAHGEFTGQYSLHGNHQYGGAKRSREFPGSQLHLELYHRPDSEYHATTGVEHRSDLRSYERARQSENSGHLQRGYGPGNDHRAGDIYRGRSWRGGCLRTWNRHLCRIHGDLYSYRESCGHHSVHGHDHQCRHRP